MRSRVVQNLFAAAAILLSSQAFAFNAGMTYHGRILKPDNSPETDSAVQFKIQIRTPGNENCLMYEEVQTKDLSASSGAFAVTLNDGSGTRTDTSGYTLDQIFGNRTTMNFSFAGAACSLGTTYSPNSTDNRKIVTQFKDSTMSSWEPLPAQVINFVPAAIESYEVGGFPSATLFRVENGSGPQSVSALTPSQATVLLNLAQGTTSYVTQTTAGAAIPSFSSDPSTPVTGSIWYDSTNKVVKYYDGTTVQTVGSGGAVSGNSITSGTIGGSTSMSTTGTVTAASVSSTSDSTKNLEIWNSGGTHKATVTVPSGLAADYPLQLPSALPSATNQFLVSDTSGVMTWSPSMAITAGGNVGIGTTTPNIRANTGTTQTIYGSGANPPMLELVGGSSQGAPVGSIYFEQTGFTGNPDGFIRGIRAPAGSNGDITVSIGHGTTDQLVVNAGGQVAIGTNQPTGILDVRPPSQGGFGTAGSNINLYAQSSSNSGNGGNIILMPGTNGGGATHDGYVGVGTTTPAEVVDVYSNTRSARVAVTSDLIGAYAPGFTNTLYKSTGGAGTGYPSYVSQLARGSKASPQALISGEVLMSLDAAGAFDGSGTFVDGARIQAISSGAWGPGAYPTDLAFSTKSTGTFTPGETMRLDTNGNVGIGTTAPTARLSVETTGGLGWNSAQLNLHEAGSGGWDLWGGSALNFGKSGTTYVSFNGGATGGITTNLGSVAAVGSATMIRNQGTLYATANNDQLNGLYIDPTFNDQAHTGVTHNGLIVTNGNVGIGTLTPAGDLAVDNAGHNATICLNGTCTTTLGGGGGSQSSTSNFVLNSNSDSTGSDGGFNFQSGGSNILQVSNTGAITTYGNITGNSALNVASGGTNQNLGLSSSGTGAVNVGTGNGTGLSVLDPGAASANYVTVKGAATGSAPVIGTAGADTNIDLALMPKGTGKVGVGTTAPRLQFEVVGDVNWGNGTTYPGSFALSSDSRKTLAMGYGSNIDGGVIDAHDQNGARLLLLNPNGGKVSIGGNYAPTAQITTNTAGAKTADFTGVKHEATATSSTASVNKIAVDIESTGTWNGTSATNTGLLVNVSGGTTNYAAAFTGGNVGVGTATPGYPLDAYSAPQTLPLRLSPTSFNSADYTGIQLYNKGGILFYRSDFFGSWGRGDIVFSNNNAGDSTVATMAHERMRITSDGMVGIGVKSPANTLSVSPLQYSTGTAAQSGTTVTGTGTSWTSAMVGSQIVFPGVTPSTITAVASATSMTVSNSATVTNQAYSINYTGLQVTSAGKVGVGTSGPGSALEVAGVMSSKEIDNTVSAASTYPTSGGIDMSLSNVFKLSPGSAGACPTAKIDFTKMTAGAPYTLAFVGYNSGTCTINDQTNSGTNVKYYGGSAQSIASARDVICTLTKVGTIVYASCLAF